MRFTLGFMLGAAAGAGTALLLTPRDGAANREWLRRKTDQLAAGDSMVSEAARTVRETVKQQRTRVERAIQTGKEAAARREATLWQQLKLTPPTDQDLPFTTPPIPPPPV